MTSLEEDRDPAPLEIEETTAEGVLFDRGPDDGDLYDHPMRPPWLREPPRKRKKAPWPRIANFSPYRITLAGTCPLRFQFRYGDQRKDPSGYAQGAGKIIHGVYHDAIQRRLRPQWKGLPTVASVDELLHLLEFQESQLALEKEDIEVTGPMLKESRELIREEGPLDCSFAWSSEHPFTLRIGSSLVVGGYIDFIQVRGNPPVQVTITDWKSGRTQLPSYEDLYYDAQGGMYLAWAKWKFPTATDIRFRIRNVREHKDVWIPWTAAHQEIHLQLARSRKALADSKVRRANPGEMGVNCRYCPYRESDGKYPACAAYEKILEKARLQSQKQIGLASKDMAELLKEFRVSRMGESLLKQRKQDLAAAILAKIPADKRHYQYADMTAVKVRGKRFRNYDRVYEFAKDLSEAANVRIEDVLADLCDVKTGKVDALVKSIDDEQMLEDVAKVIEKHERIAFGKESLQVRTAKSMW